MHTIIGLGSAGCNIAEIFEKNSNYKVKLIDVGIEGENCFALKQYKTPEEYEKNIPELDSFFSDVTKKIILIVAGSGKVSGAILSILKQLKNKELNVLYIRPDIELLNSTGRMQDRLTFKVLQEYARSGIFKKIYLTSNQILENVLGDVSILDYNEKLNTLIYNSFNAVLAFDTQECIMDNSTPPKEISRVITFGIYDLESDVEKSFYNFDFVDDKCYHFVINENEIKNNNKLLRIIKNKMKEKASENTKISYKIYSTTLEQNYCYIVYYSRKIQD